MTTKYSQIVDDLRSEIEMRLIDAKEKGDEVGADFCKFILWEVLFDHYGYKLCEDCRVIRHPEVVDFRKINELENEVHCSCCYKKRMKRLDDQAATYADINADLNRAGWKV